MTEPASPSGTPVLVGAWRKATVRSVAHPNEHAAILRLEAPDRIAHVPGQHYVIRLTADDGYTAQRSYSIASAPGDDLLEFYVERLPDGEVSSFLADVVEPGDTLDIRGPIGGWFVWDASTTLLGVAGGSGAVPFAAMLRHARSVGRADRLRLAVSARTRTDIPYLDEFTDAGALVRITRDPADPDHGRLGPDLIAPLVEGTDFRFVCGSAAFSGAASDWLMSLGVPAPTIRLESFGPTG